MNKPNWKPWTNETYFTIKKGCYRVKLDDETETYDDFKYRGEFGWGFSGYVDKHIVAYAKF